MGVVSTVLSRLAQHVGALVQLDATINASHAKLALCVDYETFAANGNCVRPCSARQGITLASLKFRVQRR